MLYPDSDRALESEEQDEFGFAGIAKKLAPSLVAATGGDGMVIGIEGPWGSGKSTMMNLLQKELARLETQNLHIISIAPWLSGDGSSLVRTLIEAMAAVLDTLEDARSSGWGWNKKRAIKYGNLLREYAAKTGRGISPLAKIAGLVLPFATAAGEGLDLGAGFLEKFGKAPTDADLKKAISDRLKSLNIRFLVLIDDLDRLEPAQAVEVVRLVRSVADFPKVAYVMCYDRAVLAHALQVGLDVTNGDLFLQKVVQLTFAIPLPEPFDLRLSLRQKALAIYEEINKRSLSLDELDELRLAIDREGQALRTPREVKLVLNGIRFAYANLTEQVYFPDICRINLIKILNPPLYAWLEKYLSLRSVLTTGDALIEEDERTTLGTELKSLLPSEDATSARSIWGLRRFIPSVRAAETAKDTVFSTESDKERSSIWELKRLASPQHYRFYFALTGPKTVLPDEQYRALLALAEKDINGLKVRLRQYIDERRPLGKSWFEYIIDQFDYHQWRRLSAKQIQGYILGISDVMLDMLNTADHIRPSMFGIGQTAQNNIREAIKQLRSLNPEIASTTLERLWTETRSLGWLIGELYRTELQYHGRVGDRAQPQQMHALTDEQLDAAKLILERRLADPATRLELRDAPHLAYLLFGWLDMSGKDAPMQWVAEYTVDDANFVKYLLQIRSWSMSDRVYYPLRKTSVSYFLDWDQTLARLDRLEKEKISDSMVSNIAEIREALEQGREPGD
ncbi:putative KAP-like P-loop ATPase [Shinella sp. BE166]|uniref:KAP family P-loop NTPase fold protein n=1 Tax=Shinella sp. BE166 TaxID=3373918 RepID=UPI003EB7FF7C